MAKKVILPALGMAQETGKIVRWLKAEGEQVAEGETLAEVETDKATVDLPAPASGMLANVAAAAGDDIPVGQVIAEILAPGELPEEKPQQVTSPPAPAESQQVPPSAGERGRAISPLAARIAAEHNLDVAMLGTEGKRIQKADVLAYLQGQRPAALAAAQRLVMASPKARRLALEQGKDLTAIRGSGPGGAVLAADVLLASSRPAATEVAPSQAAPAANATIEPASSAGEVALSSVWRLMAERTTQSWTHTPHFFLLREVRAARLLAWHAQMLKRCSENITYTDLLVKVVAVALRKHPRINATWNAGSITLHDEVNVGLAVAGEQGLAVPIIHRADTLALKEIVERRRDLVERARAGKLRPQDLQGGTFTISNLGMYGVDAFNAIINTPQAAILAVGRVAERVIAVDGQPTVQPTMMLSLSCDHRALDGALGAQFLSTLADLIEEPLAILT
jgi:pyruvate dehydrogenase E2 component (dihydrolipoamide acetyltransferase)